MRRALFPLLCLMLVTCSDEAGQPRAVNLDLIAADPVIARALNDPLMTDPDLPSRNEAHSVFGFADSTALPVLGATPQLRRAARDAWRLELLEGGSIPDLPPASERLPGAMRGPALGPMASGAEMIAAIGAPDHCAAQLEQDFAFAAALPPVAAIMPTGMVVQAGGADAAPCRIRIVRYLAAASHEDVLQYHFTRASRAGLRASRHAVPEDMIEATGAKGERLVVHVRAAAHGLSGVVLLYRAP